jgi:cardiolipin synthase
MIPAKTAVADEHWARVGSTNLNIASWFSNCELDAIVENDSFAREMEEMYLGDLENSTEIVLDRGRTTPAYKANTRPVPHSGGSAGRAAAGVVRISNTVGAAISDRRVLEPVEARILIIASLGLLTLGALVMFLPRLFAYAVAALSVWLAVALLYRGYRLHSKGQEKAKTSDSDR